MREAVPRPSRGIAKWDQTEHASHVPAPDAAPGLRTPAGQGPHVRCGPGTSATNSLGGPKLRLVPGAQV